MPDDFLAQEQKMAVRALKNCYRDAWEAIEQDTRITPLIRKRPWSSLAVAVAGGVMAGYLLLPRRGMRSMRATHSGVDAGEMGQKHRGFRSVLERELVRAVVPMLRVLAASAGRIIFGDPSHGAAHEESADETQQRVQPPPTQA